MPHPAVSVLLPYRNALATLDACLNSVRSQSLTSFEVIAVDDHSSDGSHQRLAEVACQDQRFRLFRTNRPGLVSALNHGLSQASAGLIARMDADDLMHPRRLELQRRYMDRYPEIVVLGSRVRAFAEEELSEGFRAYIRWINGCVSPEAIAGDIYLELSATETTWRFGVRDDPSESARNTYWDTVIPQSPGSTSTRARPATASTASPSSERNGCVEGSGALSSAM